jgi:hypothetical protein
MTYYNGDINKGDAVNIYFHTSNQAGAASAISGGSVVVYKDGTTSSSTSGATLTASVDSLAGFNRVTITTSSDGSFYSIGSTFSVVVAGTVDSQSVRGVVGTFSIQDRTSSGPRVVTQELGKIKQSTATNIAVGPLIHPTTGEPVTAVTAGNITARLISGVTSASITLTASGGTNDFVHIANGIFNLELASANVATLGSFKVSLVNGDAFSPYLGSGTIVAANVFDSLVGGSDKLEVDVNQAGGSAVTASSGVLDVNAKQISASAAAADSLEAAMDTTNNIIKSDVLRINSDASSASNLESYTNGSANIPADVVKIDGDSDAADRLEFMMDGSPSFTVDNAGFTPTTTAFESSATEATADHFNGRIALFVSGVLAGQQKSITDYALSGGRGKFTVNALTEAPGNGDRFIVV